MVETNTLSSVAETPSSSNSPSVPLLIVTSPLHPASPNAPAITVTRDLRVDDENNEMENYDDLDDDVFLANNEEEHNSSNSSHEDEMFPCRLFRAADSSVVRDRLVVEQFISDRLDAVLGKEEDDKETLLRRCLAEQLECPVCQEQAAREVFQCHRGHIMCHSCRPRLLTCPVCRAFLAGPPIRNMALERIAQALRATVG